MSNINNDQGTRPHNLRLVTETTKAETTIGEGENTSKILREWAKETIKNGRRGKSKYSPAQ